MIVANLPVKEDRIYNEIMYTLSPRKGIPISIGLQLSSCYLLGVSKRLCYIAKPLY